MEQRKRCGMSCGGMDDEIILRLLRENEPVAKRSESGSCGCAKRRESEIERRESRESGRCGCGTRGIGESERREPGSCGCAKRRESEKERRESRESGRCGCGTHELAYGVGTASELSKNGERCGRCAVYDRLTGLPLAMAYLPDQEWEELYGEEEALERGTMFKKLDLPFYPTPCNSRCEHRGE